MVGLQNQEDADFYELLDRLLLYYVFFKAAS